MRFRRSCPAVLVVISLAAVISVGCIEGLEQARRSLGEGQAHPEKVSLSDGTDDPNWTLRLEARPGYDLVDGNPHHWQYTNPGKPLRVLIMRVRWPEEGRQDIPIAGNLNQSMEDTRLYFLDQSWGKVEYEYVYAPVVDLPTPAASTSLASTIRDESLAATAALGYVFCGGPCGTELAEQEYRDPSQASNLNSSNFDMAVVAFRANPPEFGWAGLGVVGSAFTWTKYPTTAAVMEHEIGHNYGIGHGRTTKVRGTSETEFNSPQYEGYSRMAAGGKVLADDPLTRYNENGHFGPNNKHWYGWLQDSDVVFLHPEGNAFPDCAACQTQWTGKLNAMDRPDVIPGQENSPYFAAKIPIGTTGQEVLYVYYRTSYASSRKGISVQYCRRSFGMDSGMTGVCYIFDAHGSSYTLDDSAILPGTSYVAYPPYPLVERIGWEEAMKAIPVISVTSVPDLDNDPNCPNMVCNYDKEIAAELSIRFLSDTEKQQRSPLSVPNGNTLSPSPGLPRTLSSSSSGKVLVVAEDDAKGAGGTGELNVSVCPASGTATVYFYDDFPHAATMLSAPLSYGALQSDLLYAADCCTRGASVPASGVRAVVLRQNDPQFLNIAEIEIYTAANPAVNIAPSATCYLLPATGAYYNGNDDATAPQLIDEDYATYAHSGNPKDGGGKDFAVCVLPQPTELAKIKVVPRASKADRSENLTLEVYAEVGMSEGEDMGPVRGVGLLWQTLVQHPGAAWEAGEEYTVPSLPTSFVCDEGTGPAGPTFRYPVVHGKAFALIDAPAGAAIHTSVEYHTCPGAVADYEFDFSFPTPAPGNTQSCHPCPTRALDRNGIEACPSDSACDMLHVPGPSGGLFQARGMVDGRRRYVGRRQAEIAWNGGEGEWQLKAADGTVTATKTTNGFEPGWEPKDVVPAEPYRGVRAVAVTQNREIALNFCEMELYDENGVNIADQATCWNLPSNQGQYYTGGPNGEGPMLNDGDLETCEKDGTGPFLGRKFACIFAEPKEISKVKIYPRSGQLSRSNNLNLTLFDSIPDDSPPTMDTLSGDFSIELEAQDMSAGSGTEFEICRMPFATPQNPWATSSAISECTETRSWEELYEATDAGHIVIEEGGLGHLMQISKYEVWMCVFNASCIGDVGPTIPPQQDRAALAGADGVWGTSDDGLWTDWACFVFDEDAEVFLPWGFNSELRILPPTFVPRI